MVTYNFLFIENTLAEFLYAWLYPHDFFFQGQEQNEKSKIKGLALAIFGSMESKIRLILPETFVR